MSGALRRAGACVCLMLLAAAGSARAQVSMGAVFGKATDSTGALRTGHTPATASAATATMPAT